MYKLGWKAGGTRVVSFHSLISCGLSYLWPTKVREQQMEEIFVNKKNIERVIFIIVIGMTTLVHGYLLSVPAVSD